MPPVVHPAATIPYELASDIEHAERCMKSFDKWVSRDERRARSYVHEAVATYGRVWGRLGDRQPFRLEECRPYAVQIGLREPAQVSDDPVLAKAAEVAAALADIGATPLLFSNRMDKDLLHRSLARQAGLERLVAALGDLVRDAVQADYVHLRPGDWVSVPFWHILGRVEAVRHARARVTPVERCSNMDRIRTGHRYTTWDLINVTLEKVSPPVPPPLCLPGFEWLLRAVDAQREFDACYARKLSRLLEYHTHVQAMAFSIEMLFRSEQASEILQSYTKNRREFPEEHSACFPDWIEGRLRSHYALAVQLGELSRKQKPSLDPPPWDEPPAVLRALAELGGELIELLTHHIAGQVGREPGVQVQVYGEHVQVLNEELLGTADEAFVEYAPRLATVVGQSGRMLTVEFDPTEDRPGLYDVDITDVRA